MPGFVLPTQNPAILRSTLRAHGYAVDRGGPLTARLQNAWQHYVSGQGPSRNWNMNNPRERMMPGNVTADAGGGGGAGSARYGRQKPVVPPISPHPKKIITHAKATVAAQSLGAGAGAGGNNFPGLPDVPGGGTNTAKLLPGSMADTMAGYQFDPQIHELLDQLARGKRDTAQHQGDIGHWYGQVRDAQHTAGQRDTEAAQRAHADVAGSIQSILQSLGGSRGAGVVGAAGLNDLTGLAAQGASQDRYNADLAPLLQGEEAGAHSREAALASQAENQRNQTLVGLRGQRGQGVAKAHMDIIQANNQGRQTNFQNRLAVNNARLAAASLGLNADTAAANIAATRANTNLNQKKFKLESLAFQQKSGKMDWGRLNTTDRWGVIQKAVDQALPGLTHWDPVRLHNAALALLRTGGFTSAREKGARGVNRRNQAQILEGIRQAILARKQDWKAKHPDDTYAK